MGRRPRRRVFLLFERKTGQAVVSVGRAAGIRLQRIGIRHLHASRELEPLLRLHPHLGPAIERAARRPALLVERRRLERRGAEVHRLDDERIRRTHVAELVADAGADPAHVDSIGDLAQAIVGIRLI